MLRRSPIFIVALVLSITLRPIPITAQQNAERQQNEQLVNQKNSQSNEKAGDAEKSQQIPVQGPLTIEGPVHVVSEPSPSEIQRQANQESERQPWWKSPDWWTVGLTALALFFAFMAWRQTQDTLGEARTQTTAAVDSARVANTALLELESPNVFCSRIDIEHFKFQERPVLIAHFKNSGRALATRVRVSAVFEFAKSPVRLLQIVETDYLQGRFSIAGGETCFIAVAYPEPEGIQNSEILKDLSPSGPWQFWVAGKIEFWNPITSKLTETYYCAEYIAFGPDWPHERPAFPSDFWIFNNTSLAELRKEVADEQERQEQRNQNATDSGVSPPPT